MKKITLLIVLLALSFSWYGNAQVTSYPYSEDFEAGDGGWVATNGTNGTWALGAPTNTIINSAASGANAWVTNLTGTYNASENSFVQSPVFDLSGLAAPSIQMSVWWNAELSYDGMVLQSSVDSGASWQTVGAVGDPNNWYTDGTINGNPGGQQSGWSGRNSTNNGSGGWVVARHALTGLAGQGNVILRVAFGSDTSIQDEGVAFDSISIFEVTCPEPSALVVDSSTATTANISWTPGGAETAWEVAVQTAGTGEPTGSGDPTTTNSGYMAMSLNPATAYEVYVRSNCTGGEFSPWVGPVNFLTECVSFTAPYTEGFENAGAIPICWSMSGGANWLFDNDPGFNHIGNNGVITGTTATNGYFAWCDSSNNDGPRTLLSPLVDVSGLTTPSLSFYEISNNEGNANSTLTIDVFDGAAWVNVGVYNTNTSGWELKTIDLTTLTITGDIQARFVFSETVTGDFYDDIAIDDVTFDELPSCPIPSGLIASNITGTTADISWTAGAGETAWEYVIQAPGTGVPSGNGTPLAVSTVNETGLDYSTAYEVYIRADCGGGDFSDWLGPLNFMTTVQMNFIVDCSVGPVNSVSCYDNNGETNPQIFTFTSSDGVTPLNIVFNSGNVENTYDELIVLDSDDTTNLNPTTPYGNAGNVAGLTFQSTGPTISFYVNSETSVSCLSSANINPIDVTVSCATCVNAAATFAVRSDCLVGPQFYVDVDVTGLGSATSLTLTDNQASTPQTITAAGLVSFGPYPLLTNVQITVVNDDDPNCAIISNMLTQDVCLDNLVDCTAGPVNTLYCYDDDGDTNPVIFTYTSSDGTPLNMTFNSGNVENTYDELIVLDTDGTTNLNPTTPYGNAGNVAGLTFQSTGGTISFYVNSDFTVNCQSSTTINPLDITVTCATCINPAATYAVIDDCDNGQQFLIDVNITSIGDATSLTISNDYDANTVPVTAVGTYQIGPFPFVTPIVVTVANDQDVNCVINSTPIQVLACPPANDNCDGATVAVVNPGATCDATTPGTILAATPSGVPVGTCGGDPDDDVWFQFTALNEVQLISLINIAGGSTNLDHAVYEGTCGALTELYCSPNTASVTPQLTVGNTYYIRVFTAGSNNETSTFDLCIQTAPNNTICESAANFCGSGGPAVGSNIIGFPSAGQIACLFTTPNPSWNIIQIGESGLIEIEINQVNGSGGGLDVDFVLWGPFDTNTDFCADGVLDYDCGASGCPNNTTDPNFYPSGNIVDCSYSAAPTENLTIDNAIAGEIYVLLVTNFSNQAGTISIEQTNAGQGGAGSTVAEIQVSLGDDQDLCGFDQLELIADSPFADTYEWYANGFIIDGETGPTLTVTETNTYTVIAYDTQCDATAQDAVTITFGQEPVANFPGDLVTCDAAGTGFAQFDLESQTPAVLGTQNPANFNVTYHLSQQDANTNTGALTSPYTNISNPQTIWVRIEDANATFCSATTSFEISISGPTPTATSADMDTCDDASNDGFASFDLTINDVNILNGQSSTDFSVSYYLTEADANAATSPLASPYTNTTNPQTIWARVESVASASCYAVIDFDLIVNPVPMTTITTEGEFEVCPNATSPIILTAVGQNYSASQVSVVWYQDGGVIAGQTGLTLPVLTAGLYEVEVTFTDTGCSSPAVGQTVIELESCIIPEGISPNGDGLNDNFDLSSYDVSRLEIFNRLGTLVYSKDNYNNEWHGQSDGGDELPVGTYFYTMTYQGGKQRTAWVYINK